MCSEWCDFIYEVFGAPVDYSTARHAADLTGLADALHHSTACEPYFGVTQQGPCSPDCRCRLKGTHFSA